MDPPKSAVMPGKDRAQVAQTALAPDRRPHAYRVLRELVRTRHSERCAFDPQEAPARDDVDAILESARWAPTAHNMQNFEIVVVDTASTLDRLARVRGELSEEFLEENRAQLAFSEEELAERGTGLLATMFPPTWQSLGGTTEPDWTDRHSYLGTAIASSPVVLVVLYDPARRAPGSERDFLGAMSLGCVMENMWLTAESLGIGMQIMSVFADPGVEGELRHILGVPERLRIAFACRIGYPAAAPGGYVRVRRLPATFTHWNTYGSARPR